MDRKGDSANLDFLRSVAVLLVLGFHIDLYFLQNHYFQTDTWREIQFHQTGHWGVLMFFVHTGLVLMFSLERQWAHFPGRPLFATFLIRRTFRIFPLSMLVVLLVWLLSLPVEDLLGGHFSSRPPNWTDLLSNFLLFQNISKSPSIMATLWSLPFELQMYLLLPALYWFVTRTKSMLPVLLLWGAAAFTNSHTNHLVTWGFSPLLGLITYVPCFLAGVVAFKHSKVQTLSLPSALWPVALAAITFIYLRWPNRSYICCFLLGIAIPNFREITSPWLRKGAQVTARYSYGIYLTHFICVWLAFQAMSALPMWARWIVFASTVVLFPFLLYHGVEEPMTLMGRRMAERFQMRHSFDAAGAAYQRVNVGT
jgi:peptidoglycan/LPS O-acetylase OafA/YrhL